MITLTLAELAAALGGTVEGDDQTEVGDVAPIESAGPGDLSFVANEKYRRHIETTSASALILDETTPCARVPVIRHRNPYLAFARAVSLIYPDKPYIDQGIHESAVVDKTALVDSSSRIGSFCHVGANSQIGSDCQLLSSVYAGRNVKIGRDCLIYPGVTIMDDCRIGNRVILHTGAVIGSDGFGFAQSESGHVKFKQVGWVEIGDDVEIGANSAVDRGAIGPTRIGRGTKIDNLVQIGHNVQIGQDCIIVAQVGISGSTRIGDRVTLAGQVGLPGHIEVGDDSVIGAQSGPTKSVPKGSVLWGTPARNLQTTKRIEASLNRLPDLLKRVKKLEERSEGTDE